MTDIVDSITRSRMMSAIRGQNTAIELAVRKALFSKGYRYRINDSRLPGKPDMTLKQYHAVIFIHGCFWHLHNCHLFRFPNTNQDFWKQKLENNKARDTRTYETLRQAGWRILVVWECALKGKRKKDFDQLLDEIETWLHGNSIHSEISGLGP